jgi:adenylosuccinate synthase
VFRLTIVAASNQPLYLTVLLSGRVCAGKTSLAVELGGLGFARISTRELLLEMATPGTSPDRIELQCLGDHLDATRGGRWVAEALGARWAEGGNLVVDSIRTADQRNAIARRSRVIHIHLWAPPGVLAARYRERRRESPSFESTPYQLISETATESRIDTLGATADVVLNTARFGREALSAAVSDLLAGAV